MKMDPKEGRYLKFKIIFYFGGVFVIAALALLIAFTWVRQANGHLTPAEQSVNILPGRKLL